jgi:hypothetical protein
MIVHSQQRFNKHTYIWQITGHNDSTSTQIHDRSQPTTIPLAHKNIISHRPQRFNKHTYAWPITANNESTSTQIHDWIVVACERSCFCVLVESLWPVIGHVFVCFLNRCGLWSVMYFCDCWIVVACDRSCICVIVESLWSVFCLVFVCLLRFNNHTNTWPLTSHNDSTSTQKHYRSQATTIPQAHKYMTAHSQQRFH